MGGTIAGAPVAVECDENEDGCDLGVRRGRTESQGQLCQRRGGVTTQRVPLHARVLCTY